VIATYVPRQCGIATFTNDLIRGLAAAGGVDAKMVAINDRAKGYHYPREVAFEIQQNRLDDYRLAAEWLNANQFDVVCLQHEYGIFGGAEGRYILNLLGELRMPVVATLHTVPQAPTADQRKIIAKLAGFCDRLVVMSETARSFLESVYDVAPQAIAYAPHGIPDLPFLDPAFYKDQFGVEGRKVLLTFGLLSPNKGIESVIRALPRVAAVHPDVVYVILGATHPHVRKESDEAYRMSLQKLARELGVDDRVIFQNRFVDITELCEFLGAADIYITPYLNEEQIVSGTLAYAAGAGKAVVSTPYWYARELLADGRGRLVGFRDPGAIAEAVNALLGDETGRDAMRKRAYVHSRKAVWKLAARRYLELFNEVRRERARRPRPYRVLTERDSSAAVPEVNTDHLHRLTDDTGILQHARYIVPDRAHGYCTDDNARALIVAVGARAHVADFTEMDRLAIRYFSFLQHALDRERGAFRNFLAYDRRWCDETRSLDCHGRAVWALGLTVAGAADDRLRALASLLLEESLGSVKMLLPHLRASTFALLGIVSYLERYAGDTAAKRARELLHERLRSAFEGNADLDWPWPETVLTYANAALPHALLAAAAQLGDRAAVERALAALAWLVSIQTQDGRFSPIGNNGWYERGGQRARFDQQPIEAEATIAACARAFRVSGDRQWLRHAALAFEWFLGRNDAGQPLYDASTGGCRDGLRPNGVNENQGAESCLAWLRALVEMHALQGAARGWAQTSAQTRGARPAMAFPKPAISGREAPPAALIAEYNNDETRQGGHERAHKPV
jgi:glycosyltransferase involved in cell wall biosynthesis